MPGNVAARPQTHFSPYIGPACLYGVDTLVKNQGYFFYPETGICKYTYTEFGFGKIGIFLPYLSGKPRPHGVEYPEQGVPCFFDTFFSIHYFVEPLAPQGSPEVDFPDRVIS